MARNAITRSSDVFAARRRHTRSRAVICSRLAIAFTILGTSGQPFDRWFRDHVRQVHAIASDAGMTAPELVLDFDTSRI
jgi:hypothetical protein